MNWIIKNIDLNFATNLYIRVLIFSACFFFLVFLISPTTQIYYLNNKAISFQKDFEAKEQTYMLEMLKSCKLPSGYKADEMRACVTKSHNKKIQEIRYNIPTQYAKIAFLFLALLGFFYLYWIAAKKQNSLNK